MNVANRREGGKRQSRVGEATANELVLKQTREGMQEAREQQAQGLWMHIVHMRPDLAEVVADGLEGMPQLTSLCIDGGGSHDEIKKQLPEEWGAEMLKGSICEELLTALRGLPNLEGAFLPLAYFDDSFQVQHFQPATAILQPFLESLPHLKTLHLWAAGRTSSPLSSTRCGTCVS